MKCITVKALNSYKTDISPMCGISIQERRCQGENFSRHFFIYTAANISLHWQIPGSALAVKMVLQQGNFSRNGKV